ncbi:recombinase family protein [Streptomyces sporangiiformans]|uniref:Recombinase family protein n=1 Tax=Streptomyces sporangiiformans TaxID=2315329 RepID=A0A505DBX8_9ACTN|nr:recombinase family protein [Streptomyces sporangiiformans]TPQ20357.1 recombinase family protein [Streptomyces sporangiiformans]
MTTFGATAAEGVDAVSWDGVTIPERVRNSTSVALAVGGSLRAYVPQRPGCYLRTSRDRQGDEKSIGLQLDDAGAKLTALGWAPFAEVYRENDTSAFRKKRTVRADGSADWVVVRPEFRRMLGDLLSGRIDGVVFYDTDRLARQPRDLEDLIDVIEYTKRPAVGVTGDLNLISDADRHMARILCIMALKSSQDTSRRVARNHLADAAAGELTGRTPYAWNPDGTLRPDRARVARHIFEQFTEGVSITGIARELNRDKIPSPRGGKWAQPTVKAILTNPRYCGFVSYQGKHRTENQRQRDGWGRVLIGQDGLPVVGKWDPVIPRKLWADTQLELDHRRVLSTEKGILRNPDGVNHRKYLFTGYLRCGICRAPMSAKRVAQRGHVIYYCPGRARNACGKVSRRAEPVDEHLEKLVAEWVRGRAAPNLSDGTTAPEELQDTQARISAIRTRKGNLVTAWATGGESVSDLRPGDYYQMISTMNAELDLLERKAAEHAVAANATRYRDYAAEWSNGGFEQRRALIGEIFTAIHVMPSGKGRAPFNPAHICPVYAN